MTEQSPELFAHADLSPASPKPIHHTATSPALIPSLQERADTLDVAYLDSLVPPAFPFVTMPAATDPAPVPTESQDVADTIVVGGENYSDGDEVGIDVDEESLDAYEENGDGEKQHTEQRDPAEAAQSAPQLPAMDMDSAHPDGGNGDDDGEAAAAETEAMADTAPEQPGAPDKAVVSETSSNINTPSPSEPDVMNTSESTTAHPSTSAQAPDPLSATTTDHEPAIEEKFNPKQPQEQDVAADTLPVSAPSHPSPTGPATTADAAPKTSASAPVEEQAIIDGSGTIDIQKLVDSITAKAAEASATSVANSPSLPVPHNPSLPTPGPAPSSSSSLPLAPSSSLPAKPVLTRQTGPRPEDFHPFPSRGHNNAQSITSQPGQVIGAGNGIPHAAPYVGGAPAASTLPPHPHYPAFNTSQSSPAVAQFPPGPDGLHGAALQQAWEQFQADEKRYMTEAKWERFPENSRIFIGNLSSERVSKREVFDIFHRYGRLAQISLKSAYGFVQYHLAEDAARAMAGAQGMEIGGRKINMEFSKTQKRRDANERDHSPDRWGNRGGDYGSRGSFDRFDGRDRGGPRGRDDYRPGGRSPSPRRDSGYGRDRHQHGGYDQRNGRDRSRSPKRYGRHDQDSYRRRSPSPRRGPHEPELDATRRYGDQVPDVQILILGQLDQRFVDWVRGHFTARGLKDDVIIFNPRFSRDPLMTRMILEGVHGVVELDLASQQKAKVPLRSFDRSAGVGNVRFDQYQDLDPAQAAEVVFRTKQTQAQAPPPVAPPSAYAQSQYPSHIAYPAQPGTQPLQAYPPAGYPGYPQAPTTTFVPPAQPTSAHAPALSAQDIAGLAGKVDNATLQALLASLGPGAGQGAPVSAPPQQQQPGQPQVDINALLGSLNQHSTATPPVPAYAYNTTYAPPAPQGQPPAAAPPGGGDPVKDILATLSRYR